MTALGLTAPHPGHRCKPKPPPWYQRALARLRSARQRRAVEAARDDAYVVRIEAHVPPPAAIAAARLAALHGVLHPAGSGQPPAAVLPDEDVPRPWELETGQFPAIIDELGRQ